MIRYNFLLLIFILFVIIRIRSIDSSKLKCQALRVETANPLYFSAYIIRLLYKVADIEEPTPLLITKKHNIFDFDSDFF